MKCAQRRGSCEKTSCIGFSTTVFVAIESYLLVTVSHNSVMRLSDLHVLASLFLGNDIVLLVVPVYAQRVLLSLVARQIRGNVRPSGNCLA